MNTEVEPYPRVLMFGISFIPTSGGGITVSNLFQGWPKDKLAVANDIIVGSDSSICDNYYQLKSPFGKKMDITDSKEQKTKTVKRILKVFKKIAIFTLIGVKNYLILKGKYFKTEVDDDFLKWLDEFNPNIIYAMVYKLYHIPFLIEVTNRTNIPLAVHIVDDWVNLNHFGIFNFIGKPILRSEFNKLINKSDVLFGISDMMKFEYKKRYQKDFIPIHNPVRLETWNGLTKSSWKVKGHFKIMFAGTIEAYNIEELEQLCKAINNDDKIFLNIYGSVRSREYLERLDKYTNCKYNGLVSYDEIIELLNLNDLLFLPLSFNKKWGKNIALSMPTKVSEYMISGTPILVYAPSEVALSIIAEKEDWAYVLSESSVERLNETIISIVKDRNLREKLGKKAILTAKNKHDSDKVHHNFRKLLAAN